MDNRKHKKKTPRVDQITFEPHSKQLLLFEEAVQLFESKCQALSHFYCQCCQMTGMTIKPSLRNKSLCKSCQAANAKKEKINKELPIWYDEKGIAQYHLPQELKCLREGEKLLIQQVSAYVPLLHLQNGQLGSKGHVCSFVQDISSICAILPRLPNDVQFVKVVKKYLQEGGEIAEKMFVIRKKVVLDALK